VSEQLRLHTVTSELETLAPATLTRGRLAGHGLLRRPRAHQRTIVALDIERSTSRPDDVKAELRQTMYALFDAPSVKGALQAAPAPLVLLVSAGLDSFVHTGEPGRAFPPVSMRVGGNEHEGRVSLLPG
jgi:hypothetical protein